MWFAALFSGKNGSLIRTLVIISVVLTLVVIGYFVVKAQLKKAKETKADQQKINVIEAEIIPEKVSLAESEYNNIAQKIEDAHGTFNDDEEATYEAFQRMRTNSDLLKLQEAFGIRDDKDLFTYVRHYLNDSEIQKVNDILAQRNISIKL